MKRFLAHLLAAVFLVTLCMTALLPQAAAEGETPSSQNAYTTEIWSPAEILLHSSVDYENPYTATEIDATFTHTDGTTITLPGFWMQDEVWAVRFSPTKVGEWTYEITCKDVSNTGLFETGKIIATEATKDTEIAKHGFVTVESGKRYYQHADGTPFFWLGDTNWQAFCAVSTEICNFPGCDCGSQFKHIVDDRVEKGFNVYQTYFVGGSRNGEQDQWLDNTHERLNIQLFNEKVDDMFAYLHEQGMVIALGVGCHHATTGGIELEDLLRFTRYVVARYACYSIVWIAGQEVTAEGPALDPGYTPLDYYMEVASLIDELDGYRHPNSAHMTPIYADDERAQKLGAAEWHDAWTLQSGHSYVQRKAFYKSYYEAGGSRGVKPLVETEANYEDINCEGFTGYDLNRMGAWKSILCGSAGFTYGATGIWVSSFSTDTYTSLYGGTTDYSYEPWYMGLDKPGSFEMAYMRDFFETIGPWYELVPCFTDKRKATALNTEEYVMAATEDGSLVVCYLYYEQIDRLGKVVCLDKTKTYDTYWFNPRTGKYIPVDQGLSVPTGTYQIPDKPNKGDWVFLMTALGLGEHYEEAPFTDLNPTYAQVAPTGSVVTPVDVTANGGISYQGTPKDSQVMTDHTLWLYDGDPTTVWTPVANRTTQTFLFDLGTPQKLTHIQINPVEGTIIPTFRVEGSNDGELWTIITDTSLRDVENPGAGSEPLQGIYRYVKVLLHNARSENVGADALDTLPYKAMYNPMTDHSYSVTEIADILIYSNGGGEPTPEIPVGVPADEPDTEPVTESDPATPPADTQKPDAPTEPTDTEPDEADVPKKGCSSALGTGAAVAAIAAAAVLRKKKED